MRWIASLAMLLPLMSPAFASENWDRKAAASYLDARADLWVSRSRARQKLTTACVSCHTAMPYLLARSSIAGPSLPVPARDLYSDVTKRVLHWDQVQVWYDSDSGEEKPAESWATESVINAFVLAQRDQRSTGPLTEEAKTALRHMWARQNDEGNWEWLHFGLGPWETDGSDYWGSALAAVAAMSVADDLPPPAESSEKLRRYLRSGLSRDLSLHNRLALLWAASVWGGLLSEPEQASLVDGILERQQSDGGFRLADLGSWSSKGGGALSQPAGAQPPGSEPSASGPTALRIPPNPASDGFATAFAAFVLQRLDDRRPAEPIANAIAWLEQNQKADGRWETFSPNKDRSSEEDFTRLLMSDAATAFAVLALTNASGGASPTKP